MLRAWHSRSDLRQSGHFWHHMEMTLGASELGETGPSLSPPGPAAPSWERKAGSLPPRTQPGLESDSDLMSDS